MQTAPLAIQGLSAPPTRMRAIASSIQASDSSSKPAACSQTQRSACSTPQLWPTVARQPTTSTSAPSSTRRPLAIPSGTGASSFVRGTGRRYSAAGRRWRSTGPPPASVSSHCAIRPRARASPRNACAEAPPGGSAGSDCLTAAGAPAAGSKTVHQRAAEASGAAAAWWVVCRIQRARGERPGSASRALRNQDSYRPATGALCRPTHPVP